VRRSGKQLTLQRVPRPILVFTAFAALCASAVAVVITLSSGGPAKPRAAAPNGLVNGFYGPTAPPSMPAIDFTLRDLQGRRVRLSDYAGRPVVLVFIDSTCARLCPLVAQQLRGTLGELAQPVPVIAISVDPLQDTPAHVRSFLAAADLRGRVAYVAGPPRVARADLALLRYRPAGPG
jgi:cytochrome oxidase Cu insertion factor (SCO1/SenC/PrrC family)